MMPVEPKWCLLTVKTKIVPIETKIVLYRFGIDEITAGYIIGSYFGIQILLRPLAACSIDIIGYRAHFLILHCVV